MANEGSASVSFSPPIADYGFLSNCEQSCLVAPDGSVEWLCLPQPVPSVFGALLDRGFCSGSVPGTQMCPSIAGTYRGRWCWRRPGRPRRDG